MVRIRIDTSSRTKEKPYTIIVGFFIPVSSLEVFGHSIHSERRRICLGKSIQALQNDTIITSWLFSFLGHPANSSVAYLKNFHVCFHQFLTIAKTFRGNRLLKYLINLELIWLSATKYKPKLSHGLTCHFMLDRLYWCAKQRNRTSMLLAELWYTYQSI